MSIKTISSHFTSIIASLAVSVGICGALIAPTASAKIDNTPDCDTVAIIKCGAFSESALKKAYDKDAYGDIEKVYDAFDISRSDLSGFKSGIVYRNGDVKVDGKVVATDAMTAGRNYGGTKISGTKGVGKYSVSKFVDEGQTAFVKMEDGKFVFAIVKACGNPVSAKPKAAKPKTVTMVSVCNPDTGKVIKVKETDAADYKPVGDKACKDLVVCRLSDYKIVTIKPARYDASLYSKEQADCEEVVVEETPTPPARVVSKPPVVVVKEPEPEPEPVVESEPEEPTVIAKTGPEQFALGGLGLGSLTAAGYYFRASRRKLIDKFMNK